MIGCCMPVWDMSYVQNIFVDVNIQTGASAFSPHYAPTLSKNGEGLLFRQHFAHFRTRVK